MPDDIDETQFRPGSFGCHEALDRCSLLAELVDDLAEHPAIMLNSEWRAQADQAARILADLYSAIGRVHISK